MTDETDTNQILMTHQQAEACSLDAQLDARDAHNATLPQTPTFKAGDLVKLRSGGPKMTIDSLITGRAICIWFHEGGAKQEGSFNFETLVPA
jgi:uncharacterized protein YodC (DUF2158 family)